MSDGTTPTEVAPKITPTAESVFASVKQDVKTSTIDAAFGSVAIGSEGEKLKKSLYKIEGARKAERDHPTDLKAAMTDVSKPAEFTMEDSDELTDILTKNSVDRGKKAFKDLDKLIKYNNAARVTESKNGNLNAIDIGLGRSWEAVRNDVVKILVNEGKLLDKFPGLKEAATDDSRIILIEEVFARDPRLQSIISEKLAEILEEARSKLEPDSSIADLEKHNKSLEPISKLQEATLNRLGSTLSAESVSVDQFKQIEELVKLGETPDRVMRQVASMIKSNKNIDPNLESYRVDEDTKNLHQKEADDFGVNLQLVKADVDNKGNIKKPSEVLRLEALVRQAENRRDAADRNMEAKKNAYKARHSIPDDNVFNSKYQEFVSTTSMLKEGSPLLADITAAVENQTHIKTLNDSIRAIETNPETKAKLEIYRKNKEDISHRIENVVSSSVGEFLDKKFEDSITQEQTVLNAAAKEAAKKGEKAMEANIKLLKAQMAKFGHMDNGKIKRDRGEIGDALKEYAFYTANGEKGDGEKHLIADVIGYNMDKDAEKDSISKATFAGIEYKNLTDDQKKQVDADYDKKTADFNKLVTEHGDAYMKSLVSNFVAARGVMDRTVFGKAMGDLALKSDEWETTYNSLSTLIDKELENNTEAKGRMKSLMEKGVVPDKKMKWLIFLSIILGLGAVGGLAILPAAIGSVGAAAL